MFVEFGHDFKHMLVIISGETNHRNEANDENNTIILSKSREITH